MAVAVPLPSPPPPKAAEGLDALTAASLARERAAWERRVGLKVGLGQGLVENPTAAATVVAALLLVGGLLLHGPPTPRPAPVPLTREARARAERDALEDRRVRLEGEQMGRQAAIRARVRARAKTRAKVQEQRAEKGVESGPSPVAVAGAVGVAGAGALLLAGRGFGGDDGLDPLTRESLARERAAWERRVGLRAD